MAEHSAAWLWLLALVPSFYLLLPLLIWPWQRFPARPRLVEMDTRRLDSPLTHFLMTQTSELFELGFTEPTLVEMPNPTPLVSNYLVMMVNRQTGDKAMVTAIVGQTLPSQKALYVEFSTRFETGEVFGTHNCAVLPAFPPSPKAVRTQAPRVVDVRELYELHQFVMNKHAIQSRKVLYERGEALDYLIRDGFLKIYDEQVERGWFSYNARSDVYRPTFKGIYLLAWGLMQPIKAIRTAAMRRREERVLEEFDEAQRRTKASGLRSRHAR